MNKNIIKAVEFAYLHHKKPRKGPGVPYIVHPFGVLNILLEEQAYDKTISDDVLIAGVCHDLAEDEGIPLEEIEQLFGRKVRELVKNVTEPEHLRKNPNMKQTWEMRKKNTIKKIKEMDRDTKLLKCADKLDNAISIRNDLLLDGQKVWERFNSHKDRQKWYFESCKDAFKQGISIENTRVFRRYEIVVKELFKQEN